MDHTIRTKNILTQRDLIQFLNETPEGRWKLVKTAEGNFLERTLAVWPGKEAVFITETLAKLISARWKAIHGKRPARSSQEILNEMVRKEVVDTSLPWYKGKVEVVNGVEMTVASVEMSRGQKGFRQVLASEDGKRFETLSCICVGAVEVVGGHDLVIEKDYLVCTVCRRVK